MQRRLEVAEQRVVDAQRARELEHGLPEPRHVGEERSLRAGRERRVDPKRLNFFFLGTCMCAVGLGEVLAPEAGLGAVTVAGLSVPSSSSVAALTLSATVGAASSSRIVTVTCWVPASEAPALTASMSTMTGMAPTWRTAMAVAI